MMGINGAIRPAPKMKCAYCERDLRGDHDDDCPRSQEYQYQSVSTSAAWSRFGAPIGWAGSKKRLAFLRADNKRLRSAIKNYLDAFDEDRLPHDLIIACCFRKALEADEESLPN